MMSDEARQTLVTVEDSDTHHNDFNLFYSNKLFTEVSPPVVCSAGTVNVYIGGEQSTFKDENIQQIVPIPAHFTGCDTVDIVGLYGPDAPKINIFTRFYR